MSAKEGMLKPCDLLNCLALRFYQPSAEVFIGILEVKQLLEAQLLYTYVDVTDSPPQSLTGRLALSAISPLFVDRFGRSFFFAT